MIATTVPTGAKTWMPSRRIAGCFASERWWESSESVVAVQSGDIGNKNYRRHG
jgi:hypothetical protein